MKILMVHVGTPLLKDKPEDDERYLYRLCLEDGLYYYYSKKEIINADSQMQSLINAGINIHYGYTRNFKNPIKILRLSFYLRQIVEREKINLVHVLWGNILGLTVNLASPVPVLMSLCGSDLLGSYDKNLKKTWNGRISGFVTQIAAIISSGIITKSQDMKNRLWKISKNKTVVLPNGVNLNKFYEIDKTISRKKIGWDTKNPVILFFYSEGQYMKNKPLAEKIYNITKKEIPECELKILSKVSHEDLIYYYNGADVLINTSLHEGSNNSIKEAICCNLPVVSAPSGDAVERLVNVENSSTSKNWNENEMAQLVLKILNSQKRSNGRIFASEISEETIQAKLISIYHNLISV